MTDAQADRQLLIASNRGPVSFSVRNGTLTARRGGGGMVSGLSAAAEDTPMVWVCAALSDADREAASRSPGGHLDTGETGGGAAVLMLNIPAEVFESAYNRVANSTLWFVHHMLYDTPRQPGFGPAFTADWDAFRQYNEMFADALASAAKRAGGGGPAATRAVIQDYHICLAPRMLAERVPDLPIAHF